MIAADAERFGIDLKRIEAVDGRQIDRSEWCDFDVQKCTRCNGRRPKSGEFGCYQSHIKALRAFLETDATSAVILEDDARLNEMLQPFVAMLSERYDQEKCLVRLTTHRQPAFEKLQDGMDGYAIGQCWFGPTGSAAAYWLTRPAAEQLLQTMLPAYLPFDIMLERPWETGVQAAMVKPNLMPKPKPSHSIIMGSAVPEDGKFAWYNRLTTLDFRIRLQIGRVLHCLRTRSKDWQGAG